MKTFRQILAETEEEFEYEIRSCANIHTTEKLEQIRAALRPYRVISVEAGAYKVPSEKNEDFPNHPTYTVHACTGFPIPWDNDNPVQIIALHTRINQANLKVESPHKPKEPANEKGEYTPMTGNDLGKATPDAKVEDGQSKVGLKRLNSFMKELQGERKERETDTVKREVYEAYTVVHTELAAAVGHPMRKGYYLIESYPNQNKMRAYGPYSDRPVNYAYRENALKSVKLELLHESGPNRSRQSDWVFKTTPVAESSDIPPASRLYEVTVRNLKNGHPYTIAMAGLTPEHAGRAALECVARSYGFTDLKELSVDSVK